MRIFKFEGAGGWTFLDFEYNSHFAALLLLVFWLVEDVAFVECKIYQRSFGITFFLNSLSLVLICGRIIKKK